MYINGDRKKALAFPAGAGTPVQMPPDANAISDAALCISLGILRANMLSGA
jgi:hypothetical protein